MPRKLSPEDQSWCLDKETKQPLVNKVITRKLAFALSIRSEIYTVAPVIMRLSRLNYPFSIIDISEEKGWFDKGKQYLSLDYPKPTISIGFEPDEVDKMRGALVEFLLDNEIELIIISGVSLSSLLTISTCNRMGIATLRIDSGVRSYEMRDRKEMLRQLVDRFASIHFTSLPTSTKNLLDEGVRSENIFLTGHPIADLVMRYIDESLNSSSILEELDMESNGYLLMYVDDRESLNYLDQIIKHSQDAHLPLIVPLTTELMRRLEEEDKYINYMMEYDVLFIESLDYIDHLALIYHAKQVFSDSDVVAMETSVLNKRCIFLGGDYYRPELSEGGWVINYDIQGFPAEEDFVHSGSSLQLLGGGEAADNIVNRILRMEGLPKHREVLSPTIYAKEGDRIEEYREVLDDEWKRWIG